MGEINELISTNQSFIKEVKDENSKQVGLVQQKIHENGAAVIQVQTNIKENFEQQEKSNETLIENKSFISDLQSKQKDISTQMINNNKNMEDVVSEMEEQIQNKINKLDSDV